MWAVAPWVKGRRCRLTSTNCMMNDIPRRAFAKVSADLVELPTSHYNNKNILVMVDHLTRWLIAKAIPNKEATTVANVIFKKLILEHGALDVL